MRPPGWSWRRVRSSRMSFGCPSWLASPPGRRAGCPMGSVLVVVSRAAGQCALAVELDPGRVVREQAGVELASEVRLPTPLKSAVPALPIVGERESAAHVRAPIAIGFTAPRRLQGRTPAADFAVRSA
jgi:hypothetical protein